MNTKNLNLNILVSPLPYIAVFLASLFHPIDSDLGWHLKYGQYFFENGHILKENIFSSQMQNFHWINSSWLIDLISYQIFNNFGFLGLSISGALVITATFFFASLATRLDFFEKAIIFPILLYFLAPLNSVSFRGQLLSLLFVGILFYIARIYQDGKKQALFLCPLLFALWSNLHGQFILGLILFALWMGTFVFLEYLKEKSITLNLKKEAFTLSAIFLACVFAALVNPFTIGVYQESFKHFGNPLQTYISEWVAAVELSTLWWNQIILGIAVFLGLLFATFDGKIKKLIPNISPFTAIYFVAFSVRRFIWPAYYLSIPLLKPLINFLKPNSQKYAKISGVVIFVLYIAATFAINSPISRIQNMSWQTYCQSYLKCSNEALNYLTSNQLTSNLLTYYGWGGYMIWNHPEVKPSIDGRMHLWKDDSGYSAFEEYYNYEQNFKDIDTSKYDTVLMSKEKPLYKHLEILTSQEKWQKVYKDKYAGIFTRNR